MADIPITYRIRIRNAADTADLLVVSSVPGDSMPYLEGPPSGDGAQYDPITGRSQSGQFSGRIIDAITSGTDRVVTAQLEDAGFRQQLMRRKAYWEVNVDGAGWTMLFPGELTELTLARALVWDVTVSDASAADRKVTLFAPHRHATDAAKLEPIADYLARWPHRGCFLGGPITGGFLGIPDFAGWKMRVGGRVGTSETWLEFVEGYTPPDFKWTKDGRDHGTHVNSAASEHFRAGAQEATTSLTTMDEVERGNWPGVLVDVDGAYFQPMMPTLAGYAVDIPQINRREFMRAGGKRPGILIHALAAALPVGSTVRRVRAYTAAVSETSPIYWTGHPVDLIAECCEDVEVPYNAASIETVREAIGADRLISLRITETAEFMPFLEKIMGPLGIALRPNTTGEVELFTTRVFANTPPTVELTSADVQCAEDGTPMGRTFSLNAGTAVSRVIFEHDRFLTKGSPNGSAPWAPDSGDYFFLAGRPYLINQAGKQEYPADGILVQHEKYERTNADPGAIRGREISYSIPGMLHSRSSYEPATRQLVDVLSHEIFDRWGRGVVEGEVITLRGGSGDDLVLGQEVLNVLPQLPNHNKRLVDDGSVSARAMQVVRITERPTGREVALIDSGPNAQPVATLPTFSLAADSVQGGTVANATITNAATLNAAVIGVRVQMAVTSGATPASTDYVDVAFHPAGFVPTGAVALPAVVAGSKVFVRMRSEQVGARPSNWQTAGSVTLSAIAAPSGLSATPDASDGALCLLAWTPGAGATQLPTDVTLRLTAESASLAVRVKSLPPGSTQFTLEGLTPGTAYTAGVQHRDPTDGNVSALTTVAFTAGATTVTLDAPTDATGFSGRQLEAAPDSDAYYGLAVVATITSGFVEVAEAVETAVGSGVYGAFVTAGREPVVQGEWTVWQNVAPSDGLRRQLKARHTRDGATSSSYSAVVTVTPWAAVPLPLLPTATAGPVAVLAETASDATTVTFTMDGRNGDGSTGALEWQYIVWRDKLDAVPAWPGTWLAAPTYALPYAGFAHARHPSRDQHLRVRVRDAEGRISDVAARVIPAQIPSIDDAGAPKRAYPYDDGGYGTRATDAGGVVLHGDVVETGGGGRLVGRLYAKPLVADADDADAVDDGVTRRTASTGYVDSLGRPTWMYDTTLTADVAANDINVGQTRARGGFTNATGALVSTAVESGGKEVRRLFAKPLPGDTDDADSVGDGVLRRTASAGYTDSLGRPTHMYDSTLLASVAANDVNVGQARARATIDSSNRVKRANGFDDGGYGAKATDSGGVVLHGDVVETGGGGRLVGRLYAKPLVADADDADSIDDGVLRRTASAGYTDSLGRPTHMYDATLVQSVAANDINVGQSRARTALDADSRIVSQTRLPMASVGNRLSLQSTSPLSSYWDSGALSSYISIASHTLYYGGASVSYTGGTITGLGQGVLRYVYASDPTFAGGTVTYLATDTPSDILAGAGYYYVGKITTATSSSGGTTGSSGSAGGVTPT